ncbi:MAG TPA: sigma-70 region 4 domain-containing protein [Armatimonadota bacterium]|nr:sigma-70 region 4 domain-containing protein [Armatimonadota bacterium]
MLAIEFAARLCKRARLSANQSRVFTLYVTERLTLAQIAERLEMSVSTATTHYYRAVEKVRTGQERCERAEEWYHWLLTEAMGTGKPSRPATPVYTNVSTVATLAGHPILTGETARYQGAKPVTVDDLAHPGAWRRVERSPDVVRQRQKSRSLKAPRDKARGGL